MTPAPSSNAKVASVSVVICCYSLKRWQDLCDAISSAESQVPPTLEVVVVVDHNAELQRLVKAKFGSVIVVENRHGSGLSGARNSGIEASSGSLIVFLDDDAVAEPGMIATLAANLDDEHVLGAVAKIVPEWLAGAPSWFPPEFLWVVGCAYRGMMPGRVRNLIGAAMCIRRSVFDTVGGFTDGVGRAASGLPLGCEETELCIRANAAHSDSWFVYDADAICQHKVPGERGKWLYFATRCLAEGWSKAHISTLTRNQAALSSERVYVLKTLPAGVLSGCCEALVKGNGFGFAKALAIVFGLSITTLSFLIAKMSFVLRRSPSEARAGVVASAQSSQGA